MIERILSGVLAPLSIVAVVVLGASGFLRTYLFTPAEGAAGLLTPTIATVALAAAVVVGLIALGTAGTRTETGRGLDTPYW